jgi:enoyl-CoA hydratase/carnithine racemase
MSFVRFERSGEIALVTLDRPKANAFTPEFIEELRGAVRDAAESRGMVLASSLPTIFSGGWDLPFLISRPEEELAAHVDTFCALVREIFVFGGPVIAALSGHAIAGGLIVAAAADERIAAEGRGEFGLSEVALGVPVPASCLEIFRHVLGPRGMERLAVTGENLSLGRAIEAGLVDRAVPAGEVLDRALERAQTLASRSPNAHAEIKRRARAAALARFDQAGLGDPFLKYWGSADAQKRIHTLVENLTARRETAS